MRGLNRTDDIVGDDLKRSLVATPLFMVHARQHTLEERWHSQFASRSFRNMIGWGERDDCGFLL